jgi:hypothetical protein
MQTAADHASHKLLTVGNGLQVKAHEKRTKTLDNFLCHGMAFNLLNTQI